MHQTSLLTTEHHFTCFTALDDFVHHTDSVVRLVCRSTRDISSGIILSKQLRHGPIWSICTTPSSASVLYLSHLPTPMAAVKLLYRPHIDTCPCTSTGHTYAQLNLTHSIGVNHCDSLFKLWHYHTCCRPRSNWTEETVAATICCYILLETLLMLLHPFATASFHDSLMLG